MQIVFRESVLLFGFVGAIISCNSCKVSSSTSFAAASICDNLPSSTAILKRLRLIRCSVPWTTASLDTIYTNNFSKFSLLPPKYPRSVSGVDIWAGASCSGTQHCIITPPFFSRRHAAYCRADSPIVPITHKVTPNKRF